MPSIKLYIATTLYGYIAKPDGNLDWLHNMPNPQKVDFGYDDFISGIDTLVMGRKTYEAIIGFDVEWPYGNCRTYIVTQNKELAITSPNTHLLNTIDANSLELLKKDSTKDIWIVGGGQLISRFIELGQIDEMTLSIVPKLIGEGIRLFPPTQSEHDFELTRTESFENGLVNLHYKKRQF